MFLHVFVGRYHCLHHLIVSTSLKNSYSITFRKVSAFIFLTCFLRTNKEKAKHSRLLLPALSIFLHTPVDFGNDYFTIKVTFDKIFMDEIHFRINFSKISYEMQFKKSFSKSTFFCFLSSSSVL